MPKIQIKEPLFYKLLGYTPKFEQLEKELIYAKAEIDGPADNEGYLKIELNDTNRPDLWSAAGLARQLKVYKNATLKKYDFFSQSPSMISSPTKKIIVDPRLEKIRPYVVGFVISGLSVTDDILLELIQTQEKLCDNFGQKRYGVSIGIYRDNLINWPVHYEAVDPKKTKFVPLDFTEELTLEQILVQHPKGKEYGHLLKDFTHYPLLRDKNNKVLSMPPIINSAHIGAVKVGDNSLLFECTGYNIEQLMLVCNIFACDCIDLGFTVTRIEVEYSKNYNLHYKKNNVLTAPDIFQSSLTVNTSEIQSMLGKKLTKAEITSALTKMNIQSKVTQSGFEISTPPYRNDFLHNVDVIEDVMMGHGMDSFVAEYPKNFTIGRLTDIELFSRKLITIMVGLGFQEMIFPYLGSRIDFIDNMYEPSERKKIEKTMIRISNPISENYEFVRASIIPNLLQSEHVSAHSSYPHRMCEIGKVAVQDNTLDLCTRTYNMLGFLMADTSMGFTDINSIIAAIFYYSFNIDDNQEWYPHEISDSRFIEGRVVQLMIKNKNNNADTPVGIFGEVHPRILKNFDISMPCVAGELNIDKLLC